MRGLAVSGPSMVYFISKELRASLKINTKDFINLFQFLLLFYFQLTITYIGHLTCLFFVFLSYSFTLNPTKITKKV